MKVANRMGADVVGIILAGIFLVCAVRFKETTKWLLFKVTQMITVLYYFICLAFGIAINQLFFIYMLGLGSAFCSYSMYGIPFKGVDYATGDKKEGMKGILAKHLQIFDVCDAKGYKAGLISWLAESATINPSALLSLYVKYEKYEILFLNTFYECYKCQHRNAFLTFS